MPNQLSIPAAPCVAAFCADCGHAHVGGVCTYQVGREVVIAGEVGRVEYAPCDCQKFTRAKSTRCAFKCGCQSPKCGCIGHCHRHADAILAHRNNPDHKLHQLALTARHPRD